MAFHGRALSMARESGFPGRGEHYVNYALEQAARNIGLPRNEEDIRAWQSAGRGRGPTMRSLLEAYPGQNLGHLGKFKEGQPFASYLQLLSQRREAGIDPFDFSIDTPSGRPAGEPGAGAVATPEAAEQARLARGGRGTELLAPGSATGGFLGVPSRGADRGAPSRFAGEARAAEQRRIGLRTAGGGESRGRGRGARLTSGLGMPGRGKTLLG
jgi:hypothetical protein